jgi:splicing factor 3A subunit 3
VVDAAEDLESLGLEALKMILGSQGLKTGGTLAERARRLFLLKNKTVEELDRKHRASK